MNIGKLSGSFAALAVSLLFGQVALASHSVALSGNQNYLYTVSDDGLTWTKKAGAFGMSFCQAVAPGDGYIYAREGGYGASTKISRYDADGTKVSTFINAAAYLVDHICVSADKVWLYASGMKTADANLIVSRYRLSNPSIGGAYITIPQPQVRQIACGNDGYLYLASRTLPGAYAYDATLPSPLLAQTYRTSACTGGLILDEANGKIDILSANGITQFDMGDPDTKKSLSVANFDNPFASGLIGGVPYGCSWANCVIPKIGVGAAQLASVDTKVVNVNGMLVLDDVDTGTLLPQITGVWYMNEGTGTSCNGANPGTFDLVCRNGARGTVAGVVRGGLYLADGAFGTFASSSAMFPATGDFSFTTWAAFPKRTSVRTILSNGTASFGLDADGKFAFICGGGSVTSTAAVDDGKWHFLGAIRRGGNIEIWVDGVKQTESAFDATTSIAGSASWTLGIRTDNANPLGKSWFDEIRVYPVALPASDMTYLVGIAAKDGIANLPLPVVPQDNPYSTTEAEKLGSVVDHEFSGDAAIGATSMAQAGDGSLYLVRDFGAAVGDLGAGGALYRSTDDGATWTKLSTFSFAQASLFAFNGSVFALAVDSAGLVNLGALDANGTFVWTATAFAHPAMRACQPIVKDGRVWLGYRTTDGQTFGFASAAFDGSALTDFQTYSAAYAANPKGGKNTFFAQALQGVPVVGTNGNVTVLTPAEGRIASDEWETVPEIAAQVIATSATAGQQCVPIRFPGGAKAFSVVRDPQTGRYWAVVLPQHDADLVAGVCPQEISTKLALYSSPDLVEWRFHGDLADSGDRLTTRLSTPTAAIVGGDLVIAFAAAVDDGTGAAVSVTTPNFLVVRKVAGFRALFKDSPFWPHDRKFILFLQTGGQVAWNSGASCVQKFYFDSASGDMLPGGILIHASGGQALRVHGDRIFIGFYNASNNLKIYSREGVFQRQLTVCPTAVDCIAVTSNGRFVYCSNQDGNVGRVYVVDTTDWTSKKVIDEDGLKMPRSMVMMPDDSLVVGGRNGKKLMRYPLNADGTCGTPTELDSGFAYQAMCLSEDGKTLYAGLQGGGINVYDVATWSKSSVSFKGDPFDLLCYRGQLLSSTYGGENSRPGGFGWCDAKSSTSRLMRYIAPAPATGGARMSILKMPSPGMFMLFK